MPIDPNDPTNPPSPDDINLDALNAQLNTPEEPIIPDPSDVISDSGKPVYAAKRLHKIKALTDIDVSKVGQSIQAAFSKRIGKTTRVTTEDDRTAEVLHAATPSVIQKKQLDRIFRPRVSQYLANEKDTVMSSKDAGTQVADVLKNQQKTDTRRYVRDKSDELIADVTRRAAHSETTTILSSIATTTQRGQDFFERTFKKYMMTSLELKYRHIFVSKDILHTTRLMLSTLESKLDSIKHNTALSEVAKLSLFGEMKRAARLKVNQMLTDAVLEPIKTPILKSISSTVSGIKDKIISSTKTGVAKFKEDSILERTTAKIKEQAERAGISPERLARIKMPKMTSLKRKMSNVVDAVRPVVFGPRSDLAAEADVADDRVTVEESVTTIIPGLLRQIHDQSVLITDLMGRSTDEKLATVPISRRPRPVVAPRDIVTSAVPEAPPINQQALIRSETAAPAPSSSPRMSDRIKAAAKSLRAKAENIEGVPRTLLDRIKSQSRGVSHRLHPRELLTSIPAAEPEMGTWTSGSIFDMIDEMRRMSADEHEPSAPGIRERMTQAKDQIHAKLSDAQLPDIRESISTARERISQPRNTDKIKETIQAKIDEISKGIKSTATHARDAISMNVGTLRTILTNRDSTKTLPEGETPTDVESSSDTIDGLLQAINDSIIEQFGISHDLSSQSIDIENQILMKIGSGSPEVSGQPSKLRSLAKSLGSIGKKGAGMYYRGTKKLYSKAFGIGKSVAKYGALAAAGAVAIPAAAAGAGAYGAYKAAPKLLNLGKKAAGMYANGTKAYYGGLFKVAKHLVAPKNKYIDIHRKDEVKVDKPLLQGVKIKNGDYVFQDGNVVADSFSINRPVYDRETKSLLVTQDDIDHGLVDTDNKALKGGSALTIGIKLAKTLGKGYIGALKLSAKAAFGLAKGTAGVIASVARKIPGVRSLIPSLGKSKDKKLAGTVDTKTLDSMVTQHLLTIISMLKPITDKFKSEIREGGYADYLRDRQAEATKPKAPRAHDLGPAGMRTGRGLGGALMTGGGMAMSGLQKLINRGKDDSEGEESEGGGVISDTVKGAAGVGILGWLKNKIFKKGAETVAKKTAGKLAGRGLASAAGQAVKVGGRALAGTVARFGIGSAIRTMAVSGATALAGAVSMPVLLSGLAVAGLAAGGYALWKWKSGSSRRESITEIRNEVYRVPKDKIKVLIELEDKLADIIRGDADKSALTNTEIREFMKRFDLKPEDGGQYNFFKYWYSSVFFPIFKASYDMIEQSFHIKFNDQHKLTDDQLNEYKSSLQESSIYRDLMGVDIELSKQGYDKWKIHGNSIPNADTRGPEAQQATAEKLVENTNNRTTSIPTNVPMPKERRVDQIDTSLPDEPETHWWQFNKKKKPVMPGDTGPSGAPVKFSKSWKELEGKIIKQLIGLGWTEAQAIGIAANINQESKGNPAAVGDSGRAYGIAQWHPDRQGNFQAWTGKSMKGSSLEDQVAFIDFELRKGEERRAGEMLKNSNTPDRAAAMVSRYYERPANQVGEMTKRANIATSIAEGRSTSSEPNEAIASVPVVGVTPSGPVPAEVAQATTAAIDKNVALSSPADQGASQVKGEGVPNQSVEAYITTNKQKSALPVIAAAENVTRTVETTVKPASQDITHPEVTVVDPEGKNQTKLLMDQNIILGQIAEILGASRKEEAKASPTSKPVQDTLIADKLDGLIGAIHNTNAALLASIPNANDTAKMAMAKVTAIPKKMGISVSRELAS